MKYNYYVVGTKQKIYILENGEKKSKEVYYHYVERVCENINLYHVFKDIPNLNIIHWFATKKQAEAAAELWNQEMKKQEKFKYDYVDWTE